MELVRNMKFNPVTNSVLVPSFRSYQEFNTDELSLFMDEFPNDVYVGYFPKENIHILTKKSNAFVLPCSQHLPEAKEYFTPLLELVAKKQSLSPGIIKLITFDEARQVAKARPEVEALYLIHAPFAMHYVR